MRGHAACPKLPTTRLVPSWDGKWTRRNSNRKPLTFASATRRDGTHPIGTRTGQVGSKRIYRPGLLFDNRRGEVTLQRAIINQPVWYLPRKRHGVGVGGRKLAFPKRLSVYTRCVENDIRLTVHRCEVWVCCVLVSHWHMRA